MRRNPLKWGQMNNFWDVIFLGVIELRGAGWRLYTLEYTVKNIFEKHRKVPCLFPQIFKTKKSP